MTRPDTAVNTDEKRRFWQMGPLHVPIVLALCILFVLLNHFPVGGTDVWRHVEYGKWILDHGALPTEDPILQVADGMTVVAGSWLSQVVMGGLDRAFGAEALSVLFTLTVLATYLIVARAIFLRTRRFFSSFGGALAGLAVAWPTLLTILPANLGSLCFALLLWLLADTDDRATSAADTEHRPLFGWRQWIGVPLVMALWANLHESFVLGALFLVCGFVARLLEISWLERSLREVLVDRRLRSWLILAELGVVATLVNPYGFDLWAYAAGLLDNPILMGMPQWRPLVLQGVGGWQFGLASVLTMIALRRSRRTVRPAEVLQLGSFGIGWALHSGTVLWFAPLFAFIVTPHLASLRGRRDAPARTADADGLLAALSRRRSSINTASAAIAVASAFALSPVSAPLLAANSRDPFILHGPATPVLLAVELRSHPPEGLTLAPDWWADWLVREASPGVRPLVNRNVQVIPGRTWSDYQRISAAQVSYRRLVDRYAVGTIIVDKTYQSALGASLRQDEEWLLAYEDGQALVFNRASPPRETIGGGSSEAQAEGSG